MSLTIELQPQAEQTEFNLRRWEEILADPQWEKWQGRVETDRHGHVIMSPPPPPEHGDRQAEIAHILRNLLPEGRSITECPISTADGVRAADVIWLSPERKPEIAEMKCFVKAPEICVEVISPSNSQREMREKKALYFAAGALEVWFCQTNGTMVFFLGADSAGEKQSRICPEFPGKI
jgi:Uma2 family endonuclease